MAVFNKSKLNTQRVIGHDEAPGGGGSFDRDLERINRGRTTISSPVQAPPPTKATQAVIKQETAPPKQVPTPAPAPAPTKPTISTPVFSGLDTQLMPEPTPPGLSQPDLPPPPQSREQQMDELLREIIDNRKTDRTAARAAADTQMQRNTSDAVSSTRARTGLGGMGLSGAAAGLENAARSEGERTRTLAMDEFDRGARAEDMQRTQAGIEGLRGRMLDDMRGSEEGRNVERNERERTAFETALKQLELELNEDLDGDGSIGGSATTKEEREQRQKEDEARQMEAARPENQPVATSTQQRITKFQEVLGADPTKKLPIWYHGAFRSAGSVDAFVKQEAAKEGKSVDQWLSDFQSNPINMTWLYASGGF
jgi:hypothetical protein